MSSPSSPQSQPFSSSVQRRPLQTSAPSTVPLPQNTGMEQAESSPAVTTAISGTPQQTFISTAPSQRNTGKEKAASSLAVTTPPDDQYASLQKFLEWTLKVLGFAAACIFGIWAPLSYKAAVDGNSGNNAVQQQASAAASQQSIAASQQSVALYAMNSRIGAIGQLWLYDFCLTQTVRSHVFRNLER
jgi:hypothetical protein